MKNVSIYTFFFQINIVQPLTIPLVSSYTKNSSFVEVIPLLRRLNSNNESTSFYSMNLEFITYVLTKIIGVINYFFQFSLSALHHRSSL